MLKPGLDFEGDSVGWREGRYVRFSMVIARRVRYARKIPRRLIAVPRTPNAMVIAVSEDTDKYVSNILGTSRVAGRGRLAFSTLRLGCFCARLSTKLRVTLSIL
jgi:hypothetical protein